MKLTGLCLILRLLHSRIQNSGPLTAIRRGAELILYYQGDKMAHSGDPLLEEIDNELREIGAKLKEVLSKTDALLEESGNETRENEKIQNHDGKQPS